MKKKNYWLIYWLANVKRAQGHFIYTNHLQLHHCHDSGLYYAPSPPFIDTLLNIENLTKYIIIAISLINNVSH